MSAQSGHGAKVLWLMRILNEETDEHHRLTMSQIIERMSAHGIDCERKSVFSNIELLKSFGVDIIYERGKGGGYYVASRQFELPELKLLVDAVQASRFITEKKSLKLIDKLQHLVSRYEAVELRRQLHLTGAPKASNEEIYYTVDSIYSAIAQNKQISFRYIDSVYGGVKHYRRDGSRYVVSPYSLIWDNEYYYMAGYYEQYGHVSNFRVDKMDSVEISDNARIDADPSFDSAEYSRHQFSMFGGQMTDIRLRVERRFIGAVTDRFGSGVIVVPDGDEHVIISVRVEVSPIFIAWLFQFGGGITVLSPDSVRCMIVDTAASMAEVYK